MKVIGSIVVYSISALVLSLSLAIAVIWATLNCIFHFSSCEEDTRDYWEEYWVENGGIGTCL